MRIAIVSHPDCGLHDPGHGHPERMERYIVIQEALHHYPFNSPVDFYEAPLATREQLLAVHDKDYVDWIISISPKKDTIALDEDTHMNPHTLQAAFRAAGAVPFAVDLVMKGAATIAFCNVRPPGHHAEREKAMGFCFFNNVAVGVRHVMKEYGLKRVAIIDFDVHHGNGTQNIFDYDKGVLYCSSFEHPLYPGYDDEHDNHDHILCVPLDASTTGAQFREKVKEAWFDKLDAFKPEFIFFSAGFDAHTRDPLAAIQLEESDYVWITEQVARIARKHCEGRIVSVLEGGYNLEVLAECVPAHVNALIVRDQPKIPQGK